MSSDKRNVEEKEWAMNRVAVKVVWIVHLYCLLSKHGYRQKVIDKVISLYLD